LTTRDSNKTAQYSAAVQKFCKQQVRGSTQLYWTIR